MKKLINSLLLLGLVYLIAGCGFHLRGYGGDFKLPFKTVYLDCDSTVICPGLRSTMQHESLTTLTTHRESAEAIIVVANEQTSRDALDFNSTGQIASFILTYQVTAKVYAPKGEQLGNDIVVKNQMTMNFNNSLILSGQQQETTTWDQIHQNVINSLVRRLVHFQPQLMSPYEPESANASF